MKTVKTASDAILNYLELNEFCEQENLEWANIAPQILAINRGDVQSSFINYISDHIFIYADLIGIEQPTTHLTDQEVIQACRNPEVIRVCMEINSRLEDKRSFYKNDIHRPQWVDRMYYPKGE